MPMRRLRRLALCRDRVNNAGGPHSLTHEWNHCFSHFTLVDWGMMSHAITGEVVHNIYLCLINDCDSPLVTSLIKAITNTRVRVEICELCVGQTVTSTIAVVYWMLRLASEMTILWDIIDLPTVRLYWFAIPMSLWPRRSRANLLAFPQQQPTNNYSKKKKKHKQLFFSPQQAISDCILIDIWLLANHNCC